MRLTTLGGAGLEGSAFRRPKALLLLAYLAVEGPRERRHLRTLFWPDAADPALSLRGLLFELRTASPDLIQMDGSRLQLGIPADVTELLAAFNDAPDSVLERYTGAFLDGLSGADLGAELEEWVFLIREFLARQVRVNLLLQAERVSAAGDVKAAAALVHQAWRLPGAPPADADELQQMYQLCSAAGHSMSATLLRVARDLGVDLPAPSDPPPVVSPQPPAQTTTQTGLPTTATAFVGRETELADLQDLLADPEIRLLTLLGPGGTGKTRMAVEVARSHQASQVGYVALDAVLHAEEVSGRIANALGVDISGSQTPLEALVSKFGSQPFLLVLDNFEQLLPAGQSLAALLESCSALSILVTSREPLKLDWESVYPLGGLNLIESEEGEAVQLFVMRARKANGRFRLTPEVLPEVLQICHQVGGSPLGIELAAAWVRTLSARQIAAELKQDVQLLEHQGTEPGDQRRNLRSIFESAWSRLPTDQQLLLSGLAVFQDGFTREAASAILGATLPQLLGLLDASLLRLTEGGRYDLHPLLFSYVGQKLLEDPARRTQLNDLHARYYSAQADEGWRAFEQGKNQSHWTTWKNVEFNNLQKALEWAQEQEQWELALKLCHAQLNEWLSRRQLENRIDLLISLLAVANELTETSAYRWGLLTVCYLRLCLQKLVWDQADESRLETAITLMRQANDTVGAFRALTIQAASAQQQERWDEMGAILRTALSVAKDGNYIYGQAVVLTNLGMVAAHQLDYPEARICFTRAIEITVNHGMEWTEAQVLMKMGEIEMYAGAYAQAMARFSRAEALFTVLRRSSFLVATTLSQGEVTFFRSTLTQAKKNGDLEKARIWFEKFEELNLSFMIELGNPANAFFASVADVLLMSGDFNGARAIFEQKLRKAEELDMNILVKCCLTGLGQVAYELGDPEQAWTYFRRALAQRVDPFSSIYNVEGMAASIGRLGDGREAVVMWSAAAQIRQSLGLPMHPIYTERHETRLEETRLTLSEAEFRQAWVEGSEFTLDMAIERALSWSRTGRWPSAEASVSALRS